ncbi:MAG: hypothetical protein ABSE81_05900 [Candidatus Omnitrophota bacterium]
MPFKVGRPVLAFGSQAKNTVCFANKNFAYLSRVHNNLSNPQDFSQFKETVRYFLKKNPEILAVDLHPEYQSSKYALSLSANGYKLLTVQHHHAHIASCMLENGLKNQKVIGVAFDGTGLGKDNKIWGAEFLICDYKNFTRAGHLKEIPLIGGERAVLEPWRLAAVWLEKSKIQLPSYIDRKKWAILKDICSKKINSPEASSMGRLFDAAASIILSRSYARFEAELALELEKIARKEKSRPLAYGFNLNKTGKEYVLEPENIFGGITKDLKRKVKKEKIAFRFHFTVAEMIKQACLKLRTDTGIRKVVLSGGVFQNKLLLSLALDLLCKEGFSAFTPKVLSPNDSGVSLGEAVIAGG